MRQTELLLLSISIWYSGETFCKKDYEKNQMKRTLQKTLQRARHVGGRLGHSALGHKWTLGRDV